MTEDPCRLRGPVLEGHTEFRLATVSHGTCISSSGLLADEVTGRVLGLGLNGLRVKDIVTTKLGHDQT